MSRLEFIKQTNVSRETIERLETYEDLLHRWTSKINLISKATLPDLWDRHFLDSAQLQAFMPPEGLWADFGSGGGFPGLVLAAIARETAPNLKFTLVESDQRKCAFLRTVTRELDLNATVSANRVEAIASLEADVVSARALAPIGMLLAYAAQHLKPGGLAIFPKGASHEEELKDALAEWRFQVQTRASLTSDAASIYLFKDIVRV